MKANIFEKGRNLNLSLGAFGRWSFFLSEMSLVMLVDLNFYE